MLEVYKQIALAADTGTPVLVVGESGTGKELVARSLHFNSSRANGPFVAVSCGAIPETLLERELFGHERGAFTEARKEKRRSFEIAHGGTLFLDEIGETSPSAQVKLLRALQEGEVKRLGSELPLLVDVRIIAATIKDLSRAVAEGKFREDLFYRVNVLPLLLPPLRGRKEDIPLLAEHFIQKYNSLHRLNIQGISENALARMLEYPWPGNVRELGNAIERAMILTREPRIEADCLPSEVLGERVPWKREIWGEELAIKKASRAMAAELIRRALKKTKGNRSQAARLLEISHPALLSKIKEYGVLRAPRDNRCSTVRKD